MFALLNATNTLMKREYEEKQVWIMVVRASFFDELMKNFINYFCQRRKHSTKEGGERPIRIILLNQN